MEAKGVNGRVSFDGKIVTIHREGLGGRATFGRGDKRIPISAISAIQWKPPSRLIRGFVTFTIPGGNEGTATKGGRTRQAAGDENSVLVGYRRADDFVALIAAVETAMADL